MSNLIAYLSITSLFSLLIQNIEDTLLSGKDKCGQIIVMPIYSSIPRYENAGKNYYNLSIYHGNNYPRSKSEVLSDAISTKKKRKFYLELSFDYRIQDRKLLFLTSLIGNKNTIPGKCKIEERILFNLEDSIGTIRKLNPEGCDSNMSSKLAKITKIKGTNLYTYDIDLGGNIEASHITGLVFDDSLKIRGIYYYHYSMVQQRGKCNSAFTTYLE